MSPPQVEPDVLRFYASVYREADRLTRSPHGRLELVRTQDLLRRLLPPPPAVVWDVGGGPGTHARWLAADGYQVHVVDPVEEHVSAAAQVGDAVTAALGDAHQLGVGAAAVDAVLLLGPLYHLVERDDRVAALREAARVVRPGGPVVAAAISRQAPLMERLSLQDRIDEKTLQSLLSTHTTGAHDPAVGFTTAYLHRADELAAEFEEAGLVSPVVYGVEGPLWPVVDVMDVDVDDPLFVNAFTCAQVLETDVEVVGASAHLLAVATRM